MRNDLDWQTLGKPRPSAFQSLRTDPDLERVATFGAPGENVVAPGDAESEAGPEAQLPPVEVYRVKTVQTLEKLVPDQAPLMVSGDGQAWVPMAELGLLNDYRPVRYSGQTTSAPLIDGLQAGSAVVITDTNQRRVTQLTGSSVTRSQVLTDGQVLERSADDLFLRPDTQTMAWYPDAATITSREPGGAYPQLAHRPSAAFDDNPDTSWLTSPREDPVGSTLRVELRGPTPLSQVRITPASAPGSGRGVRSVAIVLSDGSRRTVDVSGGDATVKLTGKPQEWFEISIESIRGSGQGAVGLQDVTIPGVDLRQVLQTPDDVFRTAAGADGGEAPARAGALRLHLRASARRRSAGGHRRCRESRPSPALCGRARPPAPIRDRGHTFVLRDR